MADQAEACHPSIFSACWNRRRQTPVWAQGFAALLVGLGTVVVGGIIFRIDEVFTVQGQLKSIGGIVEVKTPAGGRVAEVLFKDGDQGSKGQLLLRLTPVRPRIRKPPSPA